MVAMNTIIYNILYSSHKSDQSAARDQNDLTDPTDPPPNPLSPPSQQTNKPTIILFPSIIPDSSICINSAIVVLRCIALHSNAYSLQQHRHPHAASTLFHALIHSYTPHPLSQPSHLSRLSPLCPVLHYTPLHYILPHACMHACATIFPDHGSPSMGYRIISSNAMQARRARSTLGSRR